VQLKKYNFDIFSKELTKVIDKLDSEDDSIIFQLLIIKPQISGVIFTSDMNTNAPYFVINYDTSGKTDLITSGAKNITQKTINVSHNAKKIPKKFKKLINVANIIIKKFRSEKLDIEFAVKKKKIFIFQVRPLPNIKKKINKKNIFNALVNIEKKIKKIKKINPSLSGNTTIFSNMADWNPAEMIGSKPHQLSYSLYSILITNSIWSKQRHLYGYKNVSPNRLMVNFAGNPYIDLRVDFNSFLPKNLSLEIENSLIDYFIDLVKKKPYLHDKVEFEVIPTCFSFYKKNEIFKVIGKKKGREYINKLKSITTEVLNIKNNIFYKDLNNIQKFRKKLEKVDNSKISEVQKIYYLLDVTKNIGALSFAGIARAAFIITSIFKDLIKLNYITKADFENFYLSINTITNKFNNDYNKLLSNKISKKNFLLLYGHLRPSTYSISSNNYSEGFDNYFTKRKIDIKKNNFKQNVFNKKQFSQINKLFKKEKFKFNFKKFLILAKKSIEGREYAKYVFTIGIDKIFENLLKLSKELKIERRDLEHLDINTIIDANNNLDIEKLRKILVIEINRNKKNYELNKLIKLPEVIKSSKDIYVNYEQNIQGNFITETVIKGEIETLNMTTKKNFKKVLKNKIVFIENADPGYDFIFLHSIKGLVTKYGGANSHMSIRCLELKIPAAIGVGEIKFEQLKNKNFIELDCKLKKISTIN